MFRTRALAMIPLLFMTVSVGADEPVSPLNKLPAVVLESCNCSKPSALTDSKLAIYNCRCGPLQCVVVSSKEEKHPPQLECR